MSDCIDMKKINVGDEVTVRGTIIEKPGDAPMVVEFGHGFDKFRSSVPAYLFATHTPKPREIKPGDMVTWGKGVFGYEFRERLGNICVLKGGSGYLLFDESEGKLRHMGDAE